MDRRGRKKKASWKDPITDRYYGYFPDKDRSLDEIDDFGKQEADSLLVVEERCAAAYNYAGIIDSLENFVLSMLQRFGENLYRRAEKITIKENDMPIFDKWAKNISFNIFFDKQYSGEYIPNLSDIENEHFSSLVIDIHINIFNYNRKILSSIVFHEMNHAFEDLRLHEKNLSIQDNISNGNINYRNVQQGLQEQEPIAYLIYHLLVPTEKNAYTAEFYGELQKANIDRNHFHQFFEHTFAYHNYLYLKKILNDCKTRKDILWDKMLAFYFKNDKDITCKKFLQIVTIKLNDYFRNLCKIASLYFDTVENNNEKQ